MLDRLADAIFRALNLVPALFVAEDSPTFWIARSVFAILLVILVGLLAVLVQQLRGNRSPRP